jgi:hypothetical protein
MNRSGIHTARTQNSSAPGKQITQYVANRRKAKFTILKYSLLGTVALLALWEILLHYDEEYFTITEVITGIIKMIF